MQLLLKFDIDTNKEDISADFWNAHNGSWKNNEKPTNITKTNNFGVDLIIEAVDNANYKTDMTKAEAFNALMEGMKILGWNKKL